MTEIQKIIKKIKQEKLLKTQVIIIVISIILGTILHFTYNLSGENNFIGTFSAVNESVWEHLKLAFFPMLILGIIEYFFVKNISNNYIEAKTIGIFLAISFIVIAFFTYTGILGVDILILDILIFITSIILGETISYKLMKRENESNNKTKVLAGIILIFLLFSFIICTFNPPKVNLFRDPITKTYGIDRAKI